MTARFMTSEELAAWHWTFDPDQLSESEQLGWLLARWRVDPICGAIEAFRMIPHRYQGQILLDLFDAPRDVYEFYELDPHFPKRQVLVPSGHGLGKTRTEALAIWLHKITHAFSKRICTAPTGDQLTGQLWGELRKLYRRLKKRWPDIAAEWEVLGSSVAHKNPEYGDWITLARTARPEKPEALQGAHALDADDEFGQLAALFGEEADNAPAGGIMIIVDESSGVDDKIREVLEGALSEEGAQLLASGNVTRPDGWFAEDLDKTDRYAVHCLDCRMSNREEIYSLPYRDFGGNVHQLQIRGFVRPKYWEDIIAECDGDEDADRVRVRVRGMKPRSAMQQIIRTNWVDQAEQRQEDEASKADPVVIALDFGLTSDKHASAVRQGFNVRDVDEWLPKDKPDAITMDAYHRAIQLQETFAPKGRCFIIGDANGVGRGAMERLAEYYREKKELNVTVIFFNAGAGALDKKRFFRRRDEMWFKHGRQFFADPRTHIPQVPGLKTELTTPGYEEDTANRIRVESKDEIKKRTGQPSGNKADATLMTLMVYIPVHKPAPKEEPKHPAVFEKHFQRLRRQQDAANGLYIR